MAKTQRCLKGIGPCCCCCCVCCGSRGGCCSCGGDVASPSTYIYVYIHMYMRVFGFLDMSISRVYFHISNAQTHCRIFLLKQTSLNCCMPIFLHFSWLTYVHPHLKASPLLYKGSYRLPTIEAQDASAFATALMNKCCDTFCDPFNNALRCDIRCALRMAVVIVIGLKPTHLDNSYIFN